MRKRLLQDEMDTHGDTYATLAGAINRSVQTLSAKMNGKSEFTQREIMTIKSRYGLTPVDVDSIFFDIKVS